MRSSSSSPRPRGAVDPKIYFPELAKFAPEQPADGKIYEVVTEHLSRHTVKQHTSAVHRKLGVRNRAQAVSRAQELGLVA